MLTVCRVFDSSSECPDGLIALCLESLYSNMPEPGEYIVGAYLKLILGCDIIDYNVRPPGGGLQGLEELNVIGINLNDSTVHICEVTTHITGLLYVSNSETIARIRKKHKRQRKYASEYLGQFSQHHFMFWSPVVPRGYLTKHLDEIEGLELIITGEYKRRIKELQMLAKKTTHNTGNQFFRMLQIMEHLRD